MVPPWEREFTCLGFFPLHTTTMSDYVPIQVPNVSLDFKHAADLTSDQQEMYQKVLSKFSDSEYKLPGQEKDGSLTEGEKFWLVGTLL